MGYNTRRNFCCFKWNRQKKYLWVSSQGLRDWTRQGTIHQSCYHLKYIEFCPWYPVKIWERFWSRIINMCQTFLDCCSWPANGFITWILHHPQHPIPFHSTGWTNWPTNERGNSSLNWRYFSPVYSTSILAWSLNNQHIRYIWIYLTIVLSHTS